jgi:hypothetical protein
VEHELKIWPDHFGAILSGAKRQEVRKNDRDFKVGDVLYLREWSPGVGYSGRGMRVIVTHIAEPEVIDDGYVILSIELENAGGGLTLRQLTKRLEEEMDPRDNNGWQQALRYTLSLIHGTEQI